MQCRTCLQKLTPCRRLPLKMRVFFGKTVEEILQFFIPGMVKSNLVDDFICPSCMDAIEIFLKFIKKFMDVENFLKGEISKQNQTQQNIDTSDSGNENRGKEGTSVYRNKANYDKLNKKLRDRLDELLKDTARDRERSRKGLQLPFNEETGFIKPQKTYPRKKRSPPRSPVEEPLVEILDSDSDATPISHNDANPKISPEDITVAGTKASERQQDVTSYDFARRSTSKICKSCGEEFISDSCSNTKCANYVSKKDVKTEGNTKRAENPLIFKNNPYIELGEDNANGPKLYSTLNLENGTSLKMVLPAVSPFSITCNTSRVVSVVTNESKSANFLKNCFQHNINLVRVHSHQESDPKRILFLGDALHCCPECKEWFLSKQSVRAHFKVAHPGCQYTSCVKTLKESKECPVCNEKFGSYLMLENHVVLQHKESYLYNCDMCRRKFKRYFSYKEHLKSYELYGDCTVKKCPICEQLVSKASYLKHCKTHQTIKCDLCKSKFASRARFNAHRSKHQSRGPAVEKEKALCPVCGELVTRGAPLRIHIENHTETRSYLCDKCTKSFKTNGNLLRHIEKVHVEGKRYECPICKAKAKHKYSLRYHMRLKHIQAYSYMCDKCGKGFSRTDYFKRHIKSHSDTRCGDSGDGRRKYRYIPPNSTDLAIPCKYCNWRFTHVSKLRLHLLHKHLKNSERPKCLYCDMTFSNIRSRMRHEKRHRDPKAFELTCNVCYNRFGSKADLDAHSVKHKESQKRVCEICGETFPSKYFLQHHVGEKHFDKTKVKNEKSALLKEGLSHVII